MSVPTRPGAAPVTADDSHTAVGIQREIDRVSKLLAYITVYPVKLPKPGYTPAEVQQRILTNGNALIDAARRRLALAA